MSQSCRVLPAAAANTVLLCGHHCASATSLWVLGGWKVHSGAAWSSRHSRSVQSALQVRKMEGRKGHQRTWGGQREGVA